MRTAQAGSRLSGDHARHFAPRPWPTRKRMNFPDCVSQMPMLRPAVASFAPSGEKATPITCTSGPTAGGSTARSGSRPPARRELHLPLQDPRQVASAERDALLDGRNRRRLADDWLPRLPSRSNRPPAGRVPRTLPGQGRSGRARRLCCYGRPGPRPRCPADGRRRHRPSPGRPKRQGHRLRLDPRRRQAGCLGRGEVEEEAERSREHGPAPSWWRWD